MKSPCLEQARLMLRILAHVAKEKCFALKGGSAINFFRRDMPCPSMKLWLIRSKSIDNFWFRSYPSSR